MRRLQRPWMAALLLVTATVMAPAAPAVAATPAAATCHGDSCNGKDPIAAGCQADQRLETGGGDGFQNVDIYYSPACHAVWAEGDNLSTGNFPDTVWAFTQPPLGAPESPLASARRMGSTAVTLMTNWDNSIKACYVYDPPPYAIDPAPAGGASEDKRSFCTPWT